MTNKYDCVEELMEPGWKIDGSGFGSSRHMLIGFTPEKMEVYKADLERYTNDLNSVYKGLLSDYKTLMEKAIKALSELGFKTEAYVENPKSRSYPKKKMRSSLLSALKPFCKINPEGIGYPHIGNMRKAKKLIEDTEAILKEQAKEDSRREQEAKLDQLATEAVAWLQGKGKKLGEDFTISQALEYANEIAFDEWAGEQAKSGNPIDFSGSDYCENCSGWIPGSHRCECGNRRVSWSTEWSSHSFKTPGEGVYAEAY
jgi:hypothetical protein